MKTHHIMILGIILIVFLLSGSLYTTYDYREFQPLMVIGSTSLIFVISLISRVSKLKIDKSSTFYFMLFTFFSVLSAIINSSRDLMFGSLLLLYIYIAISILLPAISKGIDDKRNKLIAYSLLISHLPILIFPVFLNGVKYSSYQGIFYNPNSFGVIAATVFGVLLAKIIFILEQYIEGKKVNSRSLIVNLLLVSVIFMLVIFSSSRTSFLAVILLLIISLILLLTRVVSNRKIKLSSIVKYGGFLLVTYLVLTAIYYMTPLKAKLYQGIFMKFELKSEDTLDGRLYSWTRTIDEMKVFGHGREYFQDIGMGAHNTFISILGQYGLLALLCLIVFLLIVLRNSFIYALNVTSDEYKYLPLFTIILFITLSNAEGMMLKTCMLLMFCTSSAIIKSPRLKVR